MIPIFWTIWFWSFTLQKCSKRGPLKSGGWHWSLSALRWAKKRPFLKIFDNFFFIFQKSIFLAKFTRWETKKVRKKTFFYSKTHQYISNKVNDKKSKLWTNHSILPCILAHENAQSHQYDGSKSSILKKSWIRFASCWKSD